MVFRRRKTAMPASWTPSAARAQSAPGFPGPGVAMPQQLMVLPPFPTRVYGKREGAVPSLAGLGRPLAEYVIPRDFRLPGPEGSAVLSGRLFRRGLRRRAGRRPRPALAPLGEVEVAVDAPVHGARLDVGTRVAWQRQPHRAVRRVELVAAGRVDPGDVGLDAP